ncbi:MAG: hypothetical protein AAFY20_15080 [Cyanobacteria bacterium J06639_14]
MSEHRKRDKVQEIAEKRKNKKSKGDIAKQLNLFKGFYSDSWFSIPDYFPEGISERWALILVRLTGIEEIPQIIEIIDFIDLNIDVNQEESTEIIEYKKSLKAFPRHASEEIFRYIPIGLVTCIESYFRQVYIDLVNQREDLRQNVKRLFEGGKKISVDIEMLLNIEKERITVGELVEHEMSVNKFRDIEYAIKKLTGTSLQHLLFEEMKINPIINHRLSQPSLMVFDEEFYEKKLFRISDNMLVFETKEKIWDEMQSSLKSIFDLRHKLVHEAMPVLVEQELQIISGAVKQVPLFLFLSECMVQNTLLK